MTGKYLVKKILDRLKPLLNDNPHLQRIFRDTSYLFSSNTLNMVLGILQSSLSATLLGVYNFGLLGIVTASASTVNNLFSFRMSEIIVKYLGDFLEEKDYDHAGALIKAAALVEFTFAILAFLFIWWISPILAQHLAKDPAMQSIFIFYGTIILANGLYETSYGVVQVLGRFRGQAIINSVQSIVTAILIVITFITK
ncbi:MAG: oligosaccharide flippase family protein, partial [Anaerolineaceae bacterium]|nr:oligosaccharide flippase family protein [Anaerolineaceae bacterium]